MSAVDRCAFCHDQCLAATPELRATGDQASAVSRVASMLRVMRLTERPWDRAASERVFLGLNDGLQFESCIYHAEGHRIEPYLRAARNAAYEAGFAPPSIERVRSDVIATGNVFGVHEELGDPIESRPGTPILVHDAASRILAPAGLEAARDLLRIVDGHVSELAIGSCGAVESDLGFPDLAGQALGRLVASLRRMPQGPVVTSDATVAVALRDADGTLGHELGREVIHLSRYLVTHPRIPRPTRRAPFSAVYHDSPSLARGMGLIEEPRNLLRAVAGGGLREAVPTGRRASSDGPLAGYPRPDIALAIARRRSSELVETEADCIVTACPYSVRNLQTAAPPIPVLDLWSTLAAGWSEQPEDAIRDLFRRRATDSAVPGTTDALLGPGIASQPGA